MQQAPCPLGYCRVEGNMLWHIGHTPPPHHSPSAGLQVGRCCHRGIRSSLQAGCPVRGNCALHTYVRTRARAPNCNHHARGPPTQRHTTHVLAVQMLRGVCMRMIHKSIIHVSIISLHTKSSIVNRTANKIERASASRDFIAQSPDTSQERIGFPKQCLPTRGKYSLPLLTDRGLESTRCRS
jgi:hypothetical protein